MNINSLSHAIREQSFKMPFPCPEGKDLYAHEVDGVWTITTKEGEGRHPITLHLVSSDNSQYRTARRAYDDAIMKEARQPQSKKMPAEEIDELLAKTVAAATVGWDYMVWSDDPANGSEPYLLPFTPENAIMVMRAYSPGRDKADRETQRLGNFGKVS